MTTVCNDSNGNKIKQQQKTRNDFTPTTVHAPYQVPWEPQHTSNTSEYEQKHARSFVQLIILPPTSTGADEINAVNGHHEKVPSRLYHEQDAQRHTFYIG
jgi:hypothetical protein